MTNTKIIGGQEISQKEFKKRIIEAVRAHGPCKPGDVAKALGYDDSKQQHVISRSMFNMLNVSLLKNSDGLYIPRHASNVPTIESEIIKEMKANGGLMRRRDIFESFAIRPSKDYTRENGIDARDTTEYAELRRALAESIEIVQYFPDDPKGVTYGLTRDELAKTPITGRWVHYLLSHSYEKVAPASRHSRDYNDVRQDMWKNWFSAVGIAAQMARETRGLEVADMLKDSVIESEIDRIRNLPKSWELQSSARVQAEIDAEDAGEDLTSKFFYEQLQKHREMIPLEAYARFENGDTMIHLAVRVPFYEAVADILNIDPVYLTRGAFMPKL
jgi:hypothetical protein